MGRLLMGVAVVLSMSGCSLVSSTDADRLDPPRDGGTSRRDARVTPGDDATTPTTPPTPPTPPGPPPPEPPPPPPEPPPPPPPPPSEPPFPPGTSYPTDCASVGLFPPFEEPQCSPETRRCIFDCREPGCGERCIAEDPNPDCARCTQNSFIGCARLTGCGEVFNRYVCCLEVRGCLDDPSRCPEACMSADSDRCFAGVGDICFPIVLEECFRGGGPGSG